MNLCFSCFGATLLLRLHRAAVVHRRCAVSTGRSQHLLGGETTSIPENSNIDDYTKTGEYYVSSTAVSSTITGKPTEVTASFTLSVCQYGLTNRSQFLRTITSGVFYMYWRTKLTVGWTQWQKVTTENAV